MRRNALLSALLCSLREDLSKKELRVLEGLQNGLSYKEIADALGCTVKSVDNAYTRIKIKGARKRGQIEENNGGGEEPV